MGTAESTLTTLVLTEIAVSIDSLAASICMVGEHVGSDAQGGRRQGIGWWVGAWRPPRIRLGAAGAAVGR